MLPNKQPAGDMNWR